MAGTRTPTRGAILVLLALCLTSGCAPPPARPTPRPIPPSVPSPTPIPVAPPVTLHPSEGRIDVGAAGTLWYRTMGSAPDTVVVPLGAYLQDALAPLAASHTLVFYDPRHRGRSDVATDTTLSTFAGDVRDLEMVRAALGISRMALIGYSYFGAVVAAYAAEHPGRVTRAVLLSPIEPTDSLERAYDPPERLARLDTTRARALVKLRAEGRDSADAIFYCQEYWRLNAAVFVGDTARAGRLDPSWCQFTNESPRRMGAHMSRIIASLGADRDFTRVAVRIASPVLVVVGERDLVANPAGARAWASLIRGARVLPIAGAGHFAFIEERDAIVRAIDRFLRGERP